MPLTSSFSNTFPNSHETAMATCDDGSAKDCRGSFKLTYREYLKRMALDGGKLRCISCRGEGEFDDDYFGKIDSEDKAYLLGWIANSGAKITGDCTITVNAPSSEIQHLMMLRDLFWCAIPIHSNPDGKCIVYFTINSPQCCQDVRTQLYTDSGMPDFKENDSLKWAFIRGVFDSAGSADESKQTVSLPVKCPVLRSTIATAVPNSQLSQNSDSGNKNQLVWTGTNGLDFLGKIYSNANYFLPRKYEVFTKWSTWIPSLTQPAYRLPYFNFCKTLPNAVAPFKARASDTGYDLTLVKLDKVISPTMSMFDTGISVSPEQGFYVDVVARSSLHKTGYMLANNVAIIDRPYTGPIKIVLIKIDPTLPDFTLPFVAVQMVLRPVLHFEAIEVSSLDSTGRGEGGFGSTSQK